MHMKKRSLLVITLVLILTFISGNIVSAADISQEKLNLMIASGEIPYGSVISADNTVTEENVKIKREEAREIAEKLLEDSSRYQLSNENLNRNGEMGSVVWNLDFNISQYPGGNASVTIDANTGKVVNFYCWDGTNGQQNFVVQYTRNEAKVKADEYIKNVMKEDINNYELQKEDSSYYRTSGIKQRVTYSYSYIKKIKGIYLYNSNLNIEVDAVTGKIVSFYSNIYNNIKLNLPSDKKVLTADQVMAKYKRSMNLELQYITSYDYSLYSTVAPEIKLVYMPSNNYSVNMVDAATGQFINYDGTLLGYSVPANNAVSYIPLKSDAKLDNKVITEEEAKQIAQNVKIAAETLMGIKFDDNNNSRSYSKSSYPPVKGEVWNYNWYTNYEGNNVNLSISISGNTGKILNMNLNNYNIKDEIAIKVGEALPQETQEKIDWKLGKEKAIEILQRLLPDQYGFYAEQSQQPENSVIDSKYMSDPNYSFIRIVNGIAYRENYINIGLDKTSGALKNMYFNWSDYDFPLLSDTISKDVAEGKIIDVSEAKLMYFIPTDYTKPVSKPKTTASPKLIYVVTSASAMYPNRAVDAITGDLIDTNGREVATSVSDVSQLPENWAKRSVELLVGQGILKAEGLNYNTELTKYEAIRMMSQAIGMNYYETSGSLQSFTDVAIDNQYYAFVENAVAQKIITETGGTFNGDEKITKENFIKLLIGMLGYSDLTKQNDIFKLEGVSNVTAGSTGNAAACKALGILPVEPGKIFDGEAKVTTAEAAVALYKSLNYIR